VLTGDFDAFLGQFIEKVIFVALDADFGSQGRRRDETVPQDLLLTATIFS
jgi:hypothetical protein